MFANLLPVAAVAVLGCAVAYLSTPIILEHAKSARFYVDSKIGRAASRSVRGKQESEDARVLKWSSRESRTFEDKQLRLYKKLYHEVQNLERFPDVLSLARNTLVGLLSETLCGEQSRAEGSILSLERYSKEDLRTFLQAQDAMVADGWESYLARRKSGGRRELFGTKDEARDWLAQIAPLKLVDGAWLGHIHRVTTPFALRHVTRGAWQVMAEEYGDGNLEQHHVHLYKKLLEQAGAPLPEASSADFIQPGRGLDASLSPWKAAVAQLLISLFPHDFLPEILGYNMHFELLTLDTMKAAKELDEVALDPYYFFLHISIDNSHSGHTAMAMEIVVKYLDHKRETEGLEAMRRAWKRVQAGYCLSSGLGGSPPDPATTAAMPPPLCNEWSDELLAMMQGKAQASGKIHCGSRIKVGGRTLTDWLAPESFASEQRRKDFLRELANWKPWVRKGDSENSRLMHALSWGGKMFGSFTVAEMDVVRKWIDSLDAGTHDAHAYLSFVAPSAPSVAARLEDVSVDYPVLAQSRPLDLAGSGADTELSASPAAQPVFSSLIPLWFAHIGLLEGFAAIPARTANETSCAIVRLLRSYYGFASIADGVAGMDEVRKHGDGGLVEMGLRMVQRAPDGAPPKPPSLLKQVLDRWPHAFALDMLHVSMRPVENGARLLGMAKAFVELHDAVAKSGLVGQEDCKVLAGIVSVERRLFERIEADVQRAGGATQFRTGYDVARMHVQKCLRGASDM